MRCRCIALAAVLAALVGLVAAGPTPRTAAQDGTPAPGEFELAPGLVGRELASGRFEDVPPAPAFFAILSFTNAPGAVFTTPADDPTAGLLLVESGTLTVRLAAPVTVNRATGPEEVPAGTDFVLGSGDSFLWLPYVAGETRNEGQEPAVTLLAFLAPEAEAATAAAGTPTP